MSKRKSNQISNSGNEPEPSETDHKSKIATLERDVEYLKSRLTSLESKFSEIDSKCENLKLENKVLSKKIIEVSHVKVGKSKLSKASSSSSLPAVATIPAYNAANILPGVLGHSLPSHTSGATLKGLPATASDRISSSPTERRGNWRNKHLVAMQLGTNKVLRIFRHQKEAAVKLGISQVSIVECCRGKKASAGNLSWKVYNGPAIDCECMRINISY